MPVEISYPERRENPANLARAEHALVGRDGSIDWLCWPRFDSGACFASLLGSAENGRWLLKAADPAARVCRRYHDQTLILQTEIETHEGAATIFDFMPPRAKASDVVRLVCGKRGRLAMRTELVVRFDYGSLVPWVTRLDDGTLRAIKGPDMVVLRTPVALRGERLRRLGSSRSQRRRICPRRRASTQPKHSARPKLFGASGWLRAKSEAMVGSDYRSCLL